MMKLSEEQDIAFMQMALDLAKQGEFTARPNPLVGCVMVKDGKVISKGFHLKAGLEHAEINALKDANCEGATCYVTLEPCAHEGKTGPCVNALILAKVKTVVIASVDPNPQVQGKGVKALCQAGIHVRLGVLEKEAQALNKGFFSRMIRRRPFVRAKVGMSLDGKVAMQSGESQWITCEASRMQVQTWRARSGAIITGSETVMVDNCRLTVRDKPATLQDDNFFTQPLKIVIDSQLRVPKDKAIFSQGTTWVATTQKLSAKLDQHTVVLPQKNGKVDLNALLQWLAEKEINDVLIEAGPTLVGALLQQGLIDELLLFVAPKLLGSNAKSFASLSGFDKLSDAIVGKFGQCEKSAQDLFIVLKLNEEEYL
ncbi:MAG: bifunctional diaminohydroxyphosphoribosylaminopyrimidine deaminase/5-amino-6-(5-phosphoribosylamino)uracil reductase RibD [Candidatus Berkiella sp.]